MDTYRRSRQSKIDIEIGEYNENRSREVEEGIVKKAELLVAREMSLAAREESMVGREELVEIRECGDQGREEWSSSEVDGGEMGMADEHER